MKITVSPGCYFHEVVGAKLLMDVDIDLSNKEKNKIRLIYFLTKKLYQLQFDFTSDCPPTALSYHPIRR